MTSWLGWILLGLLISIIFYESDKWIFKVKKAKFIKESTTTTIQGSEICIKR